MVIEREFGCWHFGFFKGLGKFYLLDGPFFGVFTCVLFLRLSNAFEEGFRFAAVAIVSWKLFYHCWYQNSIVDLSAAVITDSVAWGRRFFVESFKEYLTARVEQFCRLEEELHRDYVVSFDVLVKEFLCLQDGGILQCWLLHPSRHWEG